MTVMKITPESWATTNKTQWLDGGQKKPAEKKPCREKYDWKSG